MNLLNLVLMESGGNILAAQALARAAGAFLARCADAAARNRDGSLWTGPVTTQDIEDMEPRQYIAFQAMRPLLPVHGETAVRAALQHGSEFCYSMGAALFRQRIPNGMEPIEVTQAGIDREQAPTGLPSAHAFQVGLVSRYGGFRRSPALDSGDKS